MNHRTKWAVLTLVAFLLGGCGTVQNPAPPTSPVEQHPDSLGKVERRVDAVLPVNSTRKLIEQVDAAIPIGSTRTQIEAWLNQQNIEHSFSVVPFTDSPTISNALDPNYSGCVQAIIRDTDCVLPVTGSIILQFILNKDGKLKERWVRTGS
jgi:hypothetical protein